MTVQEALNLTPAQINARLEQFSRELPTQQQAVEAAVDWLSRLGAVRAAAIYYGTDTLLRITAVDPVLA